MKISNDKQHLACATSAGVKLYDLAHDADMANVSLIKLVQILPSVEKQFCLSSQCHIYRIQEILFLALRRE
jgi:hypothetical protein